MGRGPGIWEHRGEGSGSERLSERVGIRYRTSEVACGLGVDQAERSGAARKLYGLIKLKWYNTASVRSNCAESALACSFGEASAFPRTIADSAIGGED